MRGRCGPVDAVEAAKNQVPLIICKPNRLMDKGRNGARYFRNPPQPHMCIQDFIEDTNEPCFINVLSWIKISTPRKPEDPIPLYGGMRVPHNSCAALSLSTHFGAKGQPVIFAVMANPEILRLSGKTAQDPSDRDALVELMIDFVEAMNPDVRFKRQFTVLRDRDLAGELKDIWLAVQAKRERERGENGKRETDKGRESRDDWREEMRQRSIQIANQEEHENLLPLVQGPMGKCVLANSQEDVESQKEEIGQKTDNPDTVSIHEHYHMTEGISSPQLPTSIHLSTTPSTTPNRISCQHIGAMKCEADSVYSVIRSHYEQDSNRIDNGTLSQFHRSDLPTEQSFSEVLTSTCALNSQKQVDNNVVYPIFSACLVNESFNSLGDSSVNQSFDEKSSALKSVHHDHIQESSYRQKDEKLCCKKSGEKDLLNNEYRPSHVQHFSYDSINHLKEETLGKASKSSNFAPEHGSLTAEHSFSGYSGESAFLNKAQVPNMVGRSHEDLLPGLGDSTGVKFPVGSEHNTVAIP